MMRIGEPIGDRELGLVSDVASSRFVQFTDDELDALPAYLQTLATTATDP